MSKLQAIRREEKKLKKQLVKLERELGGLQSAAKALGKKASRDFSSIKKRALSASAREKISNAAKKRWAKIREQEGCRLRLMWRKASALELVRRPDKKNDRISRAPKTINPYKMPRTLLETVKTVSNP